MEQNKPLSQQELVLLEKIKDKILAAYASNIGFQHINKDIMTNILGVCTREEIMEAARHFEAFNGITIELHEGVLPTEPDVSFDLKDRVMTIVVYQKGGWPINQLSEQWTLDRPEGPIPITTPVPGEEYKWAGNVFEYIKDEADAFIEEILGVDDIRMYKHGIREAVCLCFAVSSEYKDTKKKDRVCKRTLEQLLRHTEYLQQKCDCAEKLYAGVMTSMASLREAGLHYRNPHPPAGFETRKEKPE